MNMVTKKFHGNIKPSKALEDAILNLKELFDAEYKRGMEDTAANITKALGNAPAELSKSSKRPAKRKIDRHPRVARGATRQFVERVLKEGAHSIADIRNSARTAEEKGISYQTIRLELERGKKESRYKKSKDGWIASEHA